MSFSNDSALVPKLCGILFFSITSVIIGLLPIAIHAHYKRQPDFAPNPERKAKYKQLLAHMSAFGGGVLLSTTFLHLLPEIRKSVEVMKSKDILSDKESIQLPELLMCFGFLLLYLIEELAHKIVSHKRKISLQQDCVETFVNTVYSSQAAGSANGLESDESFQQCKVNCDTVDDCGKHSIAASRRNDGDGVNVSNQENRLLCHNDSSMVFFTESSGRNFLLIFALSIHEGFEGLAIGLERQPDAVWYMVLGVGSHKAVIAFCIGVQMLSSKLNRKVAITYVLVFALTTSIGVILGLCLYMESGIFSVILQGLATGTLLHVVFFELLKPHSENTPFSGVFTGFISMAILKYFSP